ncbi:MAG: imidazole glycerol phosphate synthase subunit HisH [Deltaproteobacteria bacterium]|nr:imidazole glycerol phosphate synthase subunit HisH [Deltaproteobacteria bacterium]
MSIRKVTLIDYGMGNLGSLRRSLEECEAEVTTLEDPRELKTAPKIILPGVGAFGDGMKNLRERGWLEAIDSAVRDYKVPMLGICLGMQMMASKGFEGEECSGLNLIPGEVKRLLPRATERIPHVGWNEMQQAVAHPLFEKIPNHSDFYFVHSYHFIPENSAHVLAKTPYCGEFVSCVGHENVLGVQFHPEKSSKAGFQLLRNFLALC